MDSETERLVKDFTGVLEELTFNSKPIITTLTKLAEENISCAQYFVDALEARINKCVPMQKLYAFYALDSICKNAGSPYTIYFSRNLFALYKKTYLLVDNTTRSKLISLFKTWMTPSEATGSPLFETSSLGKIEKFLIKASALHQKNYQSMLPTPTVPLLLADIDKLTILTKQRLVKAPTDQKLNIKLQVLGQLKQELQKGKLSQAALKQVQLQLKEVFSQDQQLIQQQYEYEQKNQQRQQFQQQQQQQQQQPNKFVGSDVPGTIDSQKSSSSTPIPLFDNMTSLSSNVSSLFGNTGGVLSTQKLDLLEKTNKDSKVQNLYHSLDNLGLLYKPQNESIVTIYNKIKPKDLDASAKDSEIQLPQIDMLQNILLDCKAYFANINVNISNMQSLSFSQENLTNPNSIVQNNLIHLLYRAKSNKCNTCGKRFGNSNDEKRLLSEHLDWHFRINKRIKGSSQVITNSNNPGTTAMQKNIQSRNWYLQDSQWINFNDDDITSTKNIINDNVGRNRNRRDNKWKNGGDTSTKYNNNLSSSGGNGTLDDGTLDEEMLRMAKVPVPETNVDMTFTCPICKDTINAVYDEDSGEWVWKNAVDISGKYFHAICYYDSIKNNTGDDHSSALRNLRKLIK
ncbi:similar to Saccharomyces cerevisiae YDR228C PCF11 mRNA 3' end processing factor [Maudiozyma barnettii]|uniref:Similar to Saccharomyces cerevisiae YDR228C PCF11 mRNA 3' end processing factor n=1 Tax=Maudiozyma barnettii TaxID=61262 RepID=A0A8H2VH09_9SACH|nr:similar to Saccharomyces cerevisiae YDR228C PCF11 mRNA 3' end processing factor [Kazachstania barnettii]CAB4255029.1 similar to Saccharomyces cerevisiae YDR228C PCF11 mRNA 3' end processing factor [Kazachstania barnettii]CAD1783300.1 similar to Saccharomyces cerevisiae YDR228C PCF11 mRNA 3' end processing factor [Kazachstania barnettii]